MGGLNNPPAAQGGAVAVYVAYNSRADLRGLSPAGGDQAIVESLGMFRWYGGSTEPDDDETAFATAGGVWLLEFPHWDVADAMRNPDESAQDDRDEDCETRWPGRILRGSSACAITSVGATTQVSFTGTVAGAAVGDHVVVAPPDMLGARIACFARVTAANIITIYLNNPSAASQTIATGTWKISVIQEL